MEIFKEPICKKAAFDFLLINANFKRQELLINDENVICGRGEKYYTLTELQKIFKWTDKMKVQRFLIELQKLGYIIYTSYQKFIKVSILNYDKYCKSDTSY